MPSITHDELRSRVLSSAQVEHFIQDGFVRIDGAFPRELADEAVSSCGGTFLAIHMTARHGQGLSSGSQAMERDRSERQRTPLFYTPPSINWSAEVDGFRATALEPSRCVSLNQTTPAIPGGMSMSAFQATTATRTSSMISRPGG